MRIALTGFNVSKPSKLSQPSKPYFPRGLRPHRYYCVPLIGFNVSKPSKPSQPSKPHFPRGLRHLLHHCVAHRAFKDLNLFNHFQFSMLNTQFSNLSFFNLH